MKDEYYFEVFAKVELDADIDQDEFTRIAVALVKRFDEAISGLDISGALINMQLDISGEKIYATIKRDTVRVSVESTNPDVCRLVKDVMDEILKVIHESKSSQ